MRLIIEIFTEAREYARFNALEIAIRDFQRLERNVMHLTTERNNRKCK